MAVASTPDPLLGQAIKAVLVLREGATLDERQVKAHCRERLASYKVPKSWSLRRNCHARPPARSNVSSSLRDYMTTSNLPLVRRAGTRLRS